MTMQHGAMDRRDFLKLGAAAGAVVMASSLLPGFSWADTTSVSLEDCLALSPQQMAKNSRLVQESWSYLKATAATIKDDKTRQLISELLENPVPSFAVPLNGGGKKEAWDELTAKKLVDSKVAFADFLPPSLNPQQYQGLFFASPGSGYTSHHAYPGGVVTHTALNLRLSLAIHQLYQQTYGYELDRDVVIASQMLHDIHKGWVFQWGENGASRKELPLAGTGEHHVYGVAESMKRGLSPAICVAQACAHNHPGTPKDEQDVIGWINAAAVLAGVDPMAKGYLASDGKTLPLPRRMENFVCHLGDHDWVLTVPAVQWLLPELQTIAREKYGMTKEDLEGKKFNSFRNYAFSQATAMGFYHLYAAEGKAGLTEKLTSLITPA